MVSLSGEGLFLIHSSAFSLHPDMVEGETAVWDPRFMI